MRRVCMRKVSKVQCVLAMVLTIIMSVCTIFAISGLTSSAEVASAPRANSDRVTMTDLIGRYPVEWVVGPVDVQSGGIDKDTGKYKYIEDDAHKDWNGNYTNNIYGIPANMYFDVESYIYTESDSKTYVNEKGENVNGRILYGWKPDIQGVVSTNTTKTNVVLAENGAIPDENGKYYNANPATGIYVTYNWATTTTLANFGTTEKYALIVPEDITTVEKGSAAFVAGGSAYYSTSNGSSHTTDIGGAAFTDFGCFITSDNLGKNSAPYFWQPRERLAGVYFPENSGLQEIKASEMAGDDNSNRSTVLDIGKAAFEECDNLRFLILPGQYDTGKTDADGEPILTTGLTTIGSKAFYKCTHIFDANIPSSVTSLGDNAFAYCSEIVYLPVPDGLKYNSNVFSGCTKRRSSGTVYVMAGEPENGVPDTGKGGFCFVGAGTSWSAVALAGETGEDPAKVFVFPTSADFSDNSDRRTAVEYDFIDCDGIKKKGSFEGISVANYDVAANFARDTWCQNVILPKEVETIGSQAFFNSHVSYLETYATNIGSQAFFEQAASAKKTQWFYLLGGHKPGDYTVADNAFNRTYTQPWGGGKTFIIYDTRYVVFENKAMYDLHSGVPEWLDKGGSMPVHYQIPFVANIYNEDEITEGYDVSLLGGDMAEHFFNDSDYNANPVLKAGDNAITFTKRLSGMASNYTKQKTGEWSSSGDAAATLRPVLSNMESTVWFSLDSSADKADSAAYETVVSDIISLYSDSSTIVNVYTKNIGLPTFKTVEGKIDVNAEYTFGTTDVNENAYVAFDRALLADASYNDNKNKDYVVALAGTGVNGFTYPGDRTSSTEPPAFVQNAGTYRLSASLSTKWGVWKDSYKNTERYGVVTVARQTIDLGDIDIYPLFTTSGGSVLSGGSGDGDKTNLYFYPEGWFLNKQGGDPDNEASVINSYTRYTNNEIAISHEWEGDEDALFNITYNRGTQAAINSSQNYTYFNLRVKTIGDSQQTNYQFSDASLEANAQAFADRGMRLEGEVTSTSALLRKCWYIVMQSNWFIDANDTLDEKNPLLTPSYKLADKGTEENPWYYEDVVELHMPKLAYGHNPDGSPVTPSITIYYGSLESTPLGVVDATHPLSYYINSVMPVGKYFVVLHSDEITITEGTETATYPAADETIVFDVLPKALAYQGIVDAIQGGKDFENFYLDESGIPVYPFKYDGNIHLYGTVADDALATLNAGLNAARVKAKADGDNNYWTDAARDDFYADNATIAFNLNRWGNSIYYEKTYDVLPVGADEYSVYYCISAKNYQTYGGADDDARRDKCFKVIIYNEVSVKNDLLQMCEGFDPIYFQNVTYTGSTVQTMVPYSQFFSYSFGDEAGYINARKGATVTLTLNNAALARWNNDLTDGADKARFKVSDDGVTLTVSFDILPADNSWVVTPSMSGWSYKGYDAEVHTVSSRLQFTGITARFRLGTSETVGNWITFGEGADAVDYFTVDENGQITGVSDTVTADVIINKLNTLRPGTYYLFGYADAYAENANGIANVNALVPESGIRIVVSKAINRWSTSPDIVRWYWSEYNKAENLISGTPMYFNDENVTGQKVYFTILDKDHKAVSGLISFMVDENGVIVDDASKTIENKILALPAGTYYLLATVNATDYYFGLNEFTASADGTLTSKESGANLNYTRFVISQFNNYWETSPSMTGWQYTAYDVTTNFVAGEPKFIKDGTEVVYYLIKSDSASAPTEADFKSSTNLWNNDRTTLEVGQYWFLAVAEGTDDFTRLTAPVSFRITTNQTNAWTTIPSVSGWVYAAGGNHATEGKAAFGTAEYTVLKRDGTAATVVKDNESVELTNIAFADINALLNLLNADSYRLVITSKDGDKTGENANFVAAERTLDFTIEKALNAWQTNPAIDGWTWGETAKTPVTGVAVHDDADVTKTSLYYEASTDGTYNKGTGKAEQPTDAGYYAYVTTGSDSTNYTFAGQEYVSFFRISQFTTEWTARPEATLSWTYGEVVDGTAKLINAEVNLPASVTYAVEYTIEGKAAYTNDQITAAGGIESVLQSLGAGTYSVTAVVHGTEKTYSDVIPATTSLTIDKATLSWQTGTAPADKSWDWSEEKTTLFNVPVAVGSILSVQTPVDVTYGVVFTPANSGNGVTNANISASDLSALVNGSRFSGEAGTYVITATANDTDNFNEFTGSMTITINRVQNEWRTTGSTPVDVRKEYGKFAAEDFIVPGARYEYGGGAKYYQVIDGSMTTTEISDIVAWANNENRNQGAYTVRVFVVGTNNYDNLYKDITITVLQIKRAWSNADYGTSYTGKNYGDLFPIIVPRMDSLADAGASVTYTITYTDFIGGKPETQTIDDTNLDSYIMLNKYFNNGTAKDAGTYEITAVYASGNENIQSLETKVTVVIDRKNVQWLNGSEPPQQTGFAYEGVTADILKIPYAGENHAIGYKLKVGGTETTIIVGEDQTYKTIHDYLNTLFVGTYTLVTEIEESVNYNGKVQETLIIITRAQNGWANGHAPASVLNMTRGDENISGYVEPQALRGTLSITVTGNGESDTLTVDGLKNYLMRRPAGTYTISYSVPVDPQGNYDSFAPSDTQFVMSLQANGWDTRLNPTYRLTWGDSAIQSITAPAATNENGDAPKFTVTSLTQGVTVPPENCNADTFIGWLHGASAGTYTVVYSVDATADVAGISEASSTITISRKNNKWDPAPANTLTWRFDGTDTENVLPAFNAENIYDNRTDLRTFYINGVEVSGNIGDLRAALNSLSVGTYTLRAEIPVSTNYNAIFIDIEVTVKPNDNGWVTEGDSGEDYELKIVESEILVDGQPVKFVGWQWDSDTGNLPEKLWNTPLPQQGGIVNITLTRESRAKASETVLTFVLRYTRQDDGTLLSNMRDLEDELRVLSVGSYTMTAEIPQSENYSVPQDSAKVVQFEIKPNANEFLSKPTIADWTYGNSRNLPQGARLKFGLPEDVTYTYYLVENGTRTQVNDFNRAGSYECVASVPASAEGNYPALTETIAFNVNRANITWQTYPSITAWTWNEFDESVNLFVGAANSGGAVTFEIINTATSQSVGTFTPNENGMISVQAQLDLLRGMGAGTYSYIVTLAETTNYNGLTLPAQPLRVGQAPNRWLTYPKVTGWAENLWSSAANMPVAKSRYGNITITITGPKTNADNSVTNDYVWFSAVYSGGEEGGELIGNPTKNELYLAPGGRYTLRGTVAQDKDKYEGLDDTVEIEVFLSSSTRPANHWTVLPMISNWTAGDKGPAIDQAEAFRASEIIRTYYYEENEEKGKPVPLSEMKNGYPTLPGSYVVHLKAIFFDGEKEVEFDTLETDVRFSIHKRVIEWTITPNITSWSLGGAASTPVAAINFGGEEGSSITYKYRLKDETDDKAVSALPTKPGNYVMIVTANANYCDEVISYVDFNVSLSANQWIDLPVIEGWSEEFEANDPTGSVLVGEIKYTYMTADGVDLGEEKPTAAGDYIMYATVEVDGYETLTTPEGYAFTITPAYDPTLLTIDIILASVLCAITVVVIVFAIRRYKENG